MHLLLAWRNLWRNRRRTLITISAIFFAVLLSCVMRSAQLGVYEHMVRNAAGHFLGYAQVHAAGYWDDRILDNGFEPDTTLEGTVARTEGVTATGERLESYALAASRDRTQGVLVVGFDPQREPAIRNDSDRIVAGGRLTGAPGEGVLLGHALADRLGLGLQDSIVLLGSGYHGSFAAGKYPVHGIIDLGSPELDKRTVLAPLATARTLYGADGISTALVVGVESPGEAIAVAGRLKTRLDTTVWEVMDWKEMVPELVQFIEVDNAFSLVTLAILYLVIAFGIFGTLLMMYSERIHEFGIMTAVGMSRARLAWVFLLESAAMALLGALFGGLAAMPVVLWFQRHPIRFTGELAEVYEIYGFEPVIPFLNDPAIFAGQAAIVLGMTLLLALYPVWNLMRLVPVEALRR